MGALLPILLVLGGAEFRDFQKNGHARKSNLLSFAPEAGDGLPYVSELCDTLTSADKVGNWWCLQADGGTLPGSTKTVGGVGSPSTQSHSVCPNGPNCAAMTGQLLNGTSQYFATADEAAPTGDFSGCVLVRHDATAAVNADLISHDSNEAGNRSWTFFQGAGPTYAIAIYKTDGASTSISAGWGGERAWEFVCFTYDYIADGTSDLILYRDGTSIASDLNAVGPAQVASSTYTAVGAREYAGFRGFLQGSFRGAFLTESALSSATIAAMARAVLADAPTGSKNETLTHTRATAATCANTAGDELTTTPSGRPCITQGKIQVEAAATNLALRSEEFDNAAWTAIGTPTESANTTVGLDGSLTADTVGDDDAAATEGEQQTLTTTATAAYVLSVYAKAGTSSELHFSNDGTTCDFTVTSSWARYYCADASASGASTVQQIAIGNAVGDTGNLILWGAQFEAGSVPSSYIRTTSASTTRNAVAASFAQPTGWGDTAGCWGGEVLVSGVTAGARVLNAASGGSLYLQSTTVGRSNDGTNDVSATAGGSIVNSATRLYGGWSGTTLTANHAGIAASGTYDGALTGATIYLGSAGGSSNFLNGLIGRVTLGGKASGCVR